MITDNLAIFRCNFSHTMVTLNCKLLLLITHRWAHNPKVAGSNPAPATKKIEKVAKRWPFLFIGVTMRICRVRFGMKLTVSLF